MLKNKKDFGLKKNLFRVKQLADQGLGRAEKTEVLSEDLQNAEKKVENLKTVLQNMHKKLAVLLQAHNIGDQEKRLKKMPAYQLAQSFDENRLPIGDGMLSDVFEQCSKGLKSMGEAQVTYELIVERESLAYFQQLLDEDIPAIKKSRNYLKQLTLDMDATRSRQQSANKDSSHHPTSNNQMRSETLANELEDAEKRVAECKDRYATEMLTFISKESEICKRIAEWMDAQAQYYRSCLTHVEDMLPDMRNIIEQHSTRPVYGCPLDEHLQSSGREIALVIEACVSILYHDGLEEEGLFRIAGGAAKLKKLKAAFNVGTMADMEEYYSDLHVVAGALKLYIRELPEPLLTFDLFEEFVSCLSIQDRDSRLKKMWLTVNKLPKTNFNNVKYLIKFLSKLAEKSDINKMTNSNIAIVFGPNLIYSKNQDNAETNVAFSGIQNQVVEILVENHEYLFPGEVQFADVETFIGPTTSTPSPQAKNTMFGRRPSATPSATSALLELASNHSATKVKHQVHNDVTAAASNTSSNNSMSASTHLSTSQHSLASTDSSSASPSTLRRNKKPAPPPPPTTSPHQKLPVQHQESAPANKPNIPVRPEQPVTRHESIKKPTIPPPGPPKSSRPNNPPPPTPSGPAPSLPGQTTKAVTDSQLNSDLEPIPSSNPFDTDKVNMSDQKDMVSFSRAKSDSSSPDRETDTVGVQYKKTHTRNASADLTQSPTLKIEPKGHMRARSHDYRIKQPPPVPQRTHSIPANHSSDLGARTKNILLTQSTDDSVCTSFSTAYNNETPATASDSGRVSAGSSVSTNPFEDVIVENATESSEDDEKRDRMNSQTDFTIF